MSSSFSDSKGNTFTIECAVENEQGSYAALFSNAVTFRARHTDWGAGGSGRAPTKNTPTDSAKARCVLDHVLVTYIPLTSSVQGVTANADAAALQLLQAHIGLRRQLEHSLLRSLFDVFYTAQQLAAPPLQQRPSATVRKAVEVGGAGGSRAVSAGQGSPLSDTPLSPASDHIPSAPCVDVQDPSAAAAAAVGGGGDGAGDVVQEQLTSTTALVIVEELVEGCTLADYAEAVARRRMTATNAKMQRDAAAIVFQLAQLCHYLHSAAHVLCRAIPMENVSLDQNRGHISVRLPLTATKMIEEAEERTLVQPMFTTLPSPVLHVDDGGRYHTIAWPDELHGLLAPELRSASLCDPANWTMLGAADVWSLGVLAATLCALNHKELLNSSRLHRALTVAAHVDQLPDLLPADMQEGLLHLIRSCLQEAPQQRPTAATMLTSTAFAANRSHVQLEQHRAVISIAEAVANANKRKMPPAAVQLAESAAATASLPAAISGDRELLQMALSDVTWDTPVAFRDLYCSDDAPPGGDLSIDSAVYPVVPHMAAPSLSRATADAAQDLDHLCTRHAELFATDAASAAALSSPERGNDGLRVRLHRSRQLPRDAAATARVMEELTERFAELDNQHPDVAFRLMELLLEGLTDTPHDVAAVRESLALADALMHAKAPDAGGEVAAAAAPEPVLEESLLSDTSAEDRPRDFQVGEVLRVMPSMPSRMIASDRAANTSAVLYNQWLNKQKKKKVSQDGY